MGTAKATHQESAAPAGRRAATHLFGEFVKARAERDAAEARLARFGETIQLILAGLPQPERDELKAQFEEIKTGQQSRGSSLFDNVVYLFRSNPDKVWTVPEVKEALDSKKGCSSDAKAVANAVGYLAKTGRLIKVARGRYVVAGIGLEIEDNEERYDYGTSRVTEHDV